MRCHRQVENVRCNLVKEGVFPSPSPAPQEQFLQVTNIFGAWRGATARLKEERCQHDSGMGRGGLTFQSHLL